VRHADAALNKGIVVVTGPWRAGKSAFLASLCERIWAAIEVSSDPGVEVAPFGLGQLMIGSNTALLFLETPGPVKWDGILERAGLAEAVLGVIIVFDSAAPQQFREAKSIVASLSAQYAATRCVIAANKQDQPAAWPLDDLQVALRIPGVEVDSKL